MRVEPVEERKVHNRKLWRDTDGLWRVEGFPDLACSLEHAQTIAALAVESLALAKTNAGIIQLGGEPIPPRARR